MTLRTRTSPAPIASAVLRTALAIGFASLVVLGRCAARAHAAEAEIGFAGLALAGTHLRDGDVRYRGIVPGALLEIDAHSGRAGLRLETLPVPISVPVGAPGAFGRTSLGLSLLNAEATADLLPRGALRAGLGAQVANVSNYDGTNGLHEAARESGVSYILAGSVPFGRDGNAFDGRLSVIPNVRAELLRFPPVGTAATNASETGAETDVQLTYRWTRDRYVYRVGARGLSYSTRDTRTGALVDRNVGAGLIVEAQYRLGARETR